ncbi:hypothetical protein SCALM49S_03134 [Streptomyces californicus]
MVGPSSLYARPLPAARRMLLAGDETALPAIATVLEALPAGTGAVVYAEVADAAEERELPAPPGGAEVRWVHRDRGGSLVAAVRGAGADLDGVDAAWVAGEASAVRALRRHLVEDRELPKSAVEFSGYWRRALTQDDAPTLHLSKLVQGCERPMPTQSPTSSPVPSSVRTQVCWSERPVTVTPAAGRTEPSRPERITCAWAGPGRTPRRACPRSGTPAPRWGATTCAQSRKAGSNVPSSGTRLNGVRCL